MTESNRRHSACKADALPTELITLCRLTEAELNQILSELASVGAINKCGILPSIC